MSKSEQSPSLLSPAASTPKPQRILSCVPCQQRKIKCDRNAPCGNCIKTGAQCMSAVPTARKERRRRFPERDLLERIRRYENLLRENNIKFDPLHASSAEQTSTGADGRRNESISFPGAKAISLAKTLGTMHDVQSDESLEGKVQDKNGMIDIWRAMNQRPPATEDGDDNNDEDYESDASYVEVRHDTVKQALEHLYEKGDEQLFFGAPRTDVNILSLHPDQVQIFRLWQIYLDNVNPLLKVTHSPTLQTRIINAVGNLAGISPVLEALMFSIYCVATLSASDDEFRSQYNLEKNDLLASYQFGCQQALLKCNLLQSDDLDCLTALYLYLVSLITRPCGFSKLNVFQTSIKPKTYPRSLSMMLGIAVRIAQRMGLHSESANTKHTALEAEMRRRLWWSLVMFDARVAEMSQSSATMLVPTWDCKIPSNLNDFDLRPEMKIPPANPPPGNVGDAIFAVIRSELADYFRYSTVYLDFVNPALQPLAKQGRQLATVEKMMEDKYFKFFNPENPLHYMTMWMARSYLAKGRLLEHYSRHSRSSVQQTDVQRDAAVSYAISIFECDTKLMTSPLSKHFLWFTMSNSFPFPAYIHVVQDLRRRPFGNYAEKAWQAMSDNYDARFTDYGYDENPLLNIISKFVFQAWAAREAASNRLAEPEEPPRIVSAMRVKATQGMSNFQYGVMNRPTDAMNTLNDGFSISMMGLDGSGPPYSSFGWQRPLPSGLGGSNNMPGQGMMGVDMNQFDWNTMDWNPLSGRSW